MKKEELAKLIDGRNYREEVTEEISELAKKSGLIVIFGAGDDLVEFRGAIYDEIGAYEGINFIIATPGMVIPVDEVIEESNIEKNRFSAIWSPDGSMEGYSWWIKTEIPHAEFDILEDGEKYCRGLVVDSKDLYYQ